MSKNKIVKLSQNLHLNSYLSHEQHTHSYYKDVSLGLYVGVSNTSQIIKPAAPHAYHEFISIIEGVAEIKNNKIGIVETVMAGESFVIPKGYDCQWQQSGDLRKFHVIYNPLDENTDEGEGKPEAEISSHQSVIYFDENSRNEHSKNSPNSTPWQETSDGHKKKVLYQNPSQTFTSGVWKSKGFNTDLITFPYNEFFIIKQGNLTCTDDAGIEHKISAGEALFIPKDTRCSWLATEELTLYFVQIK